MSESEFDLLVLGGGNAITVGIRAAQKGWRVAVIEQDLLGGTCPNRGCIPSKLLIGHAEVATVIKEASRFHIEAHIDSVDRAAILRDTMAATIQATDGKIAGNLPDGVELIRGHGRFVEDKVIEVAGRRLRADKILIGTGGRPRDPAAPGLRGLPWWNSDHVFSLEKPPKSITIVGGGYIACELAFFFQGIGVRTTLVHRGPELLKNEDRDIRATFREGFAHLVDLRLNSTIEAVAHHGDRFTIRIKADGAESEHESEALLYAIGRVPNSDDIGLDRTNIATDSARQIVVDDRLRTNVDGVYALGDVTGRHLFTHAAAWEATYLADCLLEGRDEDLDYGPMPHAVFSWPEIAGVGETEDELEARGADYSATALPYSSAAKGRAIKEQHGLCKFLLDPEGRILGCHIVGQQASVLVHQVMTVMRWRNHISSLTDMIYIHPSLAEVVRNTARKARAALKG